jgi:hypothetical protein
VQRQWMCADGLQTHFLALDTSYADLWLYSVSRYDFESTVT